MAAKENARLLGRIVVAPKAPKTGLNGTKGANVKASEALLGGLWEGAQKLFLGGHQTVHAAPSPIATFGGYGNRLDSIETTD